MSRHHHLLFFIFSSHLISWLLCLVLSPIPTFYEYLFDICLLWIYVIFQFRVINKHLSILMFTIHCSLHPHCSQTQIVFAHDVYILFHPLSSMKPTYAQAYITHTHIYTCIHIGLFIFVKMKPLDDFLSSNNHSNSSLSCKKSYEGVRANKQWV